MEKIKAFYSCDGVEVPVTIIGIIPHKAASQAIFISEPGKIFQDYLRLFRVDMDEFTGRNTLRLLESFCKMTDACECADANEEKEKSSFQKAAEEFLKFDRGFNKENPSED